jgi:hypothetical protein
MLLNSNAVSTNAIVSNTHLPIFVSIASERERVVEEATNGSKQDVVGKMKLYVAGGFAWSDWLKDSL